MYASYLEKRYWLLWHPEMWRTFSFGEVEGNWHMLQECNAGCLLLLTASGQQQLAEAIGLHSNSASLEPE